MKGRDPHVALSAEYGAALVRCEYVDLGANRFDDRSTNEHSGERLRGAVAQAQALTPQIRPSNDANWVP